ncbi:uncharacterized protein E0L32_010781 [Thyridium curvatum]|uniref:Rhodanese domain-containing protein n=1 Tax=Thyridium curvatum TaxID=1093900 RepID=A0A507AM45_9PEZI|nr:uncharacterized protein E0L32_010781 [Thyridium curvatum]TPX07284.1 hypothetical protein E0L32_010781 [Thyridium curvatum]
MQNPRNIVIIGGVAGGMSCATRLRRLDEFARITIIEKGPYISSASCGIPYALGGVITDEAKLHVQTVDKIKSWFNVDVMTNTELTSIQRQRKTAVVRDLLSGKDSALPYDKLVLAMGAEAAMPSMKGLDDIASGIFVLQTITDLQNVEKFIAENNCRRAAVIGGGFIGLETVENLRKKGLEVALLEYAPHVFPLLDGDLAVLLDDELRRNQVELKLDARISEIKRSPSSSSNSTLEISLEGCDPVTADLVIVAAGVRPRNTIAKAAGLAVGPTGGITVDNLMRTSDPDVYAVGDMVETHNIVAGRDMPLALAGPANRQGRLVADVIAGRSVQYRGNVGSSVCRVFGKTAGLVGFSTERLDRLGLQYEYVTVHPPHHVAWYPGAEAMTMKLGFEVPGGRLLGLQIVGGEGVDKRVDVVATAMMAGMTAEDLEHLELAYAPPYGAAKDPINMAGFAAGNVLRGDVRIVHAADLVNGGRTDLDQFQVVDVRSVDEYSRGHLRGAVNIPLGELRQRIGELKVDKPVLAYCWVGYRGYVASRILRQGIDTPVFNLDGGFKVVKEEGYTSLQE